MSNDWFILTDVDHARVRENLTWNLFPGGEDSGEAIVQIACLAIEMFLNGHRDESVPGTGDIPGEVIANLRLQGFVHSCRWCETSDPFEEYCDQCGGCPDCCTYPAHTTCCGLSPDLFIARQGICLCGDSEPRWFDEQDERFYSTNEFLGGEPNAP